MLLARTCRARGLHAFSPAFCSNRLFCDQSDSETQQEPHQSEYEVIYAARRDKEGTRAANKLRKVGRTPAILFSLPRNESQLLSLDTKQVATLVRQHGRSGLVSRLFSLQIETPEGGSEQYMVLPRIVHRNAVTDEVENITLMHCPPERTVKIPVPVQLMGEDMAPGIKKGGYLNLTRRRLNCVGPAGLIPRAIEVDVSTLDFRHRIFVSSLQMPSGIAVVDMVEDQPLCKLGGRAARE